MKPMRSSFAGLQHHSESNIIAGTMYEHLRKTLHVNIPSFLSPVLFQHYSYSSQDIEVTLSTFDTPWIYTLALLLNVRVNRSFSKVNAHDHPSLTLCAKSLLLNKIMCVLDTTKSRALPRVTQTIMRHSVPLPVVKVPWQAYEDMVANMITPQDITQRCTTPCIFHRAGRSYVPYDADQNGVVLVRIVPKNDFIASRLHLGRYSMLTRGIDVDVDSIHYTAIDEAIFGVPEKKNKSSTSGS